MSDGFKVGDVVWRAACGTEQVRQTCPVCFGKLFVTVILGDDSAVDTPCEYCGKGYDGQKGWVTEWEYVARPAVDTISEVRRTTDESGEHYGYRLSSGHVVPVVFATIEEAQEAADQARYTHEAEQARRRKEGKEHSARSFSWRVGYHQREVKEATRKLAYHSARVQPCKDMARVERARKRNAKSGATP